MFISENNYKPTIWFGNTSFNAAVRYDMRYSKEWTSALEQTKFLIITKWEMSIQKASIYAF